MKVIVISVDDLHEMQFEKDYTGFIRGWNEAIDEVLIKGVKKEVQDDNRSHAHKHERGTDGHKTD